LELVEKYGVEYFPSPAGGCRLTENEFGVKVKQLLENDGKNRELDKVDFELLRIGRHYWLDSEQRIIDNKQDKVSEARLMECSDSETISLASDERIGEQINNTNQNKAHVILGKNHEENQQLKKSAKEGDILIELKELMGPMALIIDGANLSEEVQERIILETKKLILDRAKNPDKKEVKDVEWKML
jgi:hypothetical protein